MYTSEEIKKQVGAYAADFVEQGMIIGLGTGSTVYWLIQELGRRCRAGLVISAVPTSQQTMELARAAGITLTDLDEVERLVLTIDGADQIDKQGCMIKGGGGALLQEKIVAAASDQVVIIADSGKLVDHLGSFPLPVEVIPFGHRQVEKRIMGTGLCKRVELRKKDEAIYITDHQHYILDCSFEKIDDPQQLNHDIHDMPGVVETGLFIGLASKLVLGYEDGNIKVQNFR